VVKLLAFWHQERTSEAADPEAAPLVHLFEAAQGLWAQWPKWLPRDTKAAAEWFARRS
jgi:hypothetical protein